MAPLPQAPQPAGNHVQIPSPIAPSMANPPSTDSDEVHLQFPNTDIQIILKTYEELTGKRIITDNTVTGAVISIDITKPVTRDEAIRIIETSLYLNGYALVPTEGNIVKLVGTGKNPRSFGINIYSDISQIPDDVGIVSVVFQLQYASSEDIKKVIDAYVPNSVYTSSVPLPGAIIVTESTIMLRNIAKIIAAADVPPAEVVSRFYQLERANAKDVVDKLNKLFEKSQQQTQGGPSGAPPPRPILVNGRPGTGGSSAFPASMTGLSEDTIIVGKIKIDYDDRTNRIHVVTRPVNLPFIQNLIEQYDSDIAFGEPEKRKLKYVDAADILGVIVKAITEPGEKAEGDTESSTSGNTTQPTNNTTNSNNNNGGNSSLGSSGGGSTGLNITEGLETPERDITPKAVILGSTKIIADPRENTIIVLGNEEVKRKIFTLLDQLDVRAPQVMLNTVIGEYTLNNDSNVGVDYLLHYPSGPLANLLSSGSNSTLGSTGFLNGNAGAAVTNFTGSPVGSTLASAVGAGTGFTAAIGAANSLDVIVNALESTGRFHVTNRPMVYASNNKKAIIVSGEQIPVPTSTLSNLTGVAGETAAVQSSIDYMQVALQLEVVPLINSDKEVSLDILQKLDSPGATSNVGGSNVPAINTRYIRTNVSVPNKATIVLGGLITKTVSNNTSSIPILGRIPVLGYLFGNKAKQNDRSELIILIRPVVTTSPDEMADESHVERKRLLMEPDIDSTIAAPTPHASGGVNFRYQDDKTVQ
ncbi:MAG TPA: secretin N-terminal domain-containing protein [Chthoniobacteraceae bacterium]|jgi:type II secretion system protein D|nr:secretin N-terminal domain-containing protein [Chthoniobacteraceae bacterium]